MNGIILLPKKGTLQLERWLSSQDCALLFQRTAVSFTASTLYNSLLTVTPAAGDLVPSAGLDEKLKSLVHLFPPTHTHIYT